MRCILCLERVSSKHLNILHGDVEDEDRACTFNDYFLKKINKDYAAPEEVFKDEFKALPLILKRIYSTSLKGWRLLLWRG